MWMLEEFNKWNKKSDDEQRFTEFWNELTDKEDSWQTEYRLAWQLVQMQSVVSNIANQLNELTNAFNAMKGNWEAAMDAKKPFEAVSE